MPKLSVIVPVYNTEKYLRECVDSILAQTFTDFELILVNDGSTDGSGAICDEYALKDPRVRVIHQENGGVTRARKCGAALSQGDYVTYVDSDDWIDREAYQNILEQIEKYHADIGVFAIIQEKSLPIVIANSVGVGFFSKKMMQEAVYPKMLFDYSLNRSGLVASLCNKIIRRGILVNAINIIPENLCYGEDAVTGYLCMLNAENIYISNDLYYHYRDNPASISHASTSVMAERILILDRELRSVFSCYGTDMSSQIDGHIARHTVEHVRRELIYPTEKTYFERCRAACDFCEQPEITDVLKTAYPYIQNRKEKVKVRFIRNKWFGLLYFLFRKV